MAAQDEQCSASSVQQMPYIANQLSPDGTLYALHVTEHNLP